MKHVRLASLATLAITLVASGSAVLAKDWVAHYNDRVEAFKKENEKLDAKGRYVVLVGDSLTEGFTAGRVKKFMPTIAERVLNRGISSDGTGVNGRGVKRRLDSSVFDCHPGHVILLIGINDFGKDGKGVEGSAKSYDEIVKAIREKAKDVELILVTLAPTAKTYKAMNPAIVKMNEKIKAIAAATGTTLLDLHALVVDGEGALPEKMTSEGLHWTDALYEVYGKEIERIVTTPKKAKKK